MIISSETLLTFQTFKGILRTMASHYVSLRCIMNLHVSRIVLYILWVLEFSAVNSLPLAQYSVATPSSNNISSFTSLFPMALREKLTSEKVAELCPQLWANSSSDFENEENTGKLGSLDELEEQCYSKKNMSFACQGAIRISSYLCDASSSGFLPKKWPEPPKVENAKALKDQTILCNEIANYELLNDLCRIKKPADGSRADLNCASQEVVKHLCNSSCSLENNRMCQMILQGFKTVIYWESLKETNVADVNAPEENPNTTTKILSDAPISDEKLEKAEIPKSETIPKSTNSVQDDIKISKPVDKGEEIDKQSELKKDPSDGLKTEPAQQTSTPPAGKPSEKNPVETVETEPKTLPSSIKATTAMTTLNKIVKDEKEEKPMQPSREDGPNEEVKLQAPTVVPIFVIPALSDKKSADDITIVENISKYDDNYDMADPEDGEDDMVRTFTDGSEEINFGETRAPFVPKAAKPLNSVESLSEIDEPENTHFLLYFLTFVVLSATGYVLYQRRGRVFAYLVGGRGTRRRSSSARGVNRSGSYKKLVNNLEEAMASSSVKNTNVIY